MNKTMLRKVAQKLRRLRHEEHYDQTVWGLKTACGTAACIAGHTVVVGGWRLRPDKSCCVRGKKVRDVGDVAEDLLGLSTDEASVLFSAWPEIYWPKEYAHRWLNAGAGETGERRSRIAADLLDALADGKVTL